MRKRLLNVRHRGDDGAVAVLVGLLAVVLVGLSAFAVDFGNAYATNRTLSTAADGAALAAAQRLGEDGRLCGLAAPGASAARAIADDYSSVRNAPGSALQAGSTGFQLGTDPTDGNCTVTVRNSKAVPFAFGNLFGLGSVQPQGIATAKYGQARTVSGLRPFGLCSLDPAVLSLLSQGAPGAPRPTIRVSVANTNTTPGACGLGAPGNWGTIDLDGGSNSTAILREWITNGFNGTLDLVGQALPGDPGSPGGGALETEMNSIVGKVITLPVYGTVMGSGQNARFRIVRYISATLCGWKFENKRDARTESCGLLPSAPDGATDPDYLELRFEESFSVGDFQNCLLAGCAVSNGITNLALVETP